MRDTEFVSTGQTSPERDINHVSPRLEMLFSDFQDGAIVNLRYTTIVDLGCVVFQFALFFFSSSFFATKKLLFLWKLNRTVSDLCHSLSVLEFKGQFNARATHFIGLLFSLTSSRVRSKCN